MGMPKPASSVAANPMMPVQPVAPIPPTPAMPAVSSAPPPMPPMAGKQPVGAPAMAAQRQAPTVETPPRVGISGNVINCASCGRINTPGSSFCATCGSALPAAEVANVAPPRSSGMGANPKLRLIQEGGGDGEIYKLETDETIIGRNNGDIRFPHDGYMSGRHARIIRRGERFVLVDENSRNGTFKRIDGEVELKAGDIILIGKQLFRFEL
jgi:hypothetical protein